MSNEIKLKMLKERLNKLENNGKNIKSTGVKNKLIRQIRAIENS